MHFPVVNFVTQVHTNSLSKVPGLYVNIAAEIKNALRKLYFLRKDLGSSNHRLSCEVPHVVHPHGACAWRSSNIVTHSARTNRFMLIFVLSVDF